MSLPAELQPAPVAAAEPHAWRPRVEVVALLACATLVAALLDGEVSLTSQAMVYLVAVVVAAYRLDRLAAVLCAVGAVTAYNFFFVPPRWTLEVEHHEHLIALAAMLGVALLVSTLVARLRQETEVARLNVSRAERLRALAAALPEAATEPEALAMGRAALAAAFPGPIVLALADAGGEPPADIAEPQVRDALRCCLREGAVMGPNTARWPGLDAWYVPLGVPGRMVGAARIPPTAPGDVAALEHAQALCALLAQGLWRLRSTAAAQAARDALERQSLQGTLLAAVSHDLRTPLAAIVAAASALQTQQERLGAGDRQRMLGAIEADARHLAIVVENTLQFVRLSAGAPALRRDWQSIEEIVGAVLGRLHARAPDARVHARLAAALPLVRADATLLAQLLDNLLENARVHGAPPVELVARVEGARLLIGVEDRGPGFEPGLAARAFEPYVRGASATRGAGIGLALCKAIAEAHGGTLEARARRHGGAAVVLSLPLEPQPTLEPEVAS
jgi:two-component system sensor histidine kinase KdpD